MTRTRLRSLPAPGDLAVMYKTPHDHTLYGRGHHERVEATIALALGVIPPGERFTVADLSCGNGQIATRVTTGGGTHLGDFAVLPAELPDPKYHGPVEDTIHLIPSVDVFVCSETIEHLDDPGMVLAAARTKAVRLLLSTPLECWGDTNPEHLWAWDREGVEDLCVRAGWRTVEGFTTVDSRAYGEPYLYGVWVLS